jgi:hypothetical protein
MIKLVQGRSFRELKNKISPSLKRGEGGGFSCSHNYVMKTHPVQSR